MKRVNGFRGGGIARRHHRTQSGVSMTELLVASLLMVACTALIAELMVAITYTTTKLNNREECMISARAAIHRVVSCVRSAHSFAKSFTPANGQTPPGWPPGVFVADQQTLILKSYPASVEGSITGLEMREVDVGDPDSKPVFVLDLDTQVFRVVDDPNRFGEFQLQCMIYTSDGLPRFDSPQVIATGLKNSGSAALPTVFSYYTNDTTSGIKTFKTLPIDQIADQEQVKGITMDLRVQKSSNNDDAHQQIVCVRTEAFPASE